MSGLIGCGDDEDSGGDDTDYVSGFCASVLDMRDAASALGPASGAAPEDLEELGRVFARWADALEDLSPPADARDFHESLVDEARVVAVNLAVGSGPIDPFLALEQMTFPAEVGQRLQVIAAGDPDCTEAGVRFDAALLGG